ncbi:MAG: hypothetical protein ACI9Y7_003052 [Dokdonia sp.]|jgi:hypothetical protein
MKNRVSSLFFGAALVLLSFAFMSFQQQVEVGDAIPIDAVPFECTATLTCPNGAKISCKGTVSCFVNAQGVNCDGNVTLCPRVVDPC